MMKAATRTEYVWTLEADETFPWVKSSGAHEGHEFTVHKIQLEHRDLTTSVVYLHGPWNNGFTPEPRKDAEGNDITRDDSLRNGWEFLYADDPQGAGKIRELPLEVREALAGAGLRIPLTDAESLEQTGHYTQATITRESPDPEELR